jgi:hypothetical protein
MGKKIFKTKKISLTLILILSIISLTFHNALGVFIFLLEK